MHSIPSDEELPPSTGSAPLAGEPQPPEVEVLGDLRGHVLAGRYVLIELLASGDLGCVYSGRDQSSGQPVTIKVLAAPEHRELINRIAERARRRLGVRHPCVAAVLAEGTMGGLWYGVMELAPGKNLYHADGDPRFEGASLLALAAELAEGLSTLHALGAPHGAISPSNLVWSDAGVKLVDLDVHAQAQMSQGTGDDEPGAAGDVAALAGVVHELIGDVEAPWSAAVARVARGELRPSAAEWANQLRNAEIDALRPQVLAAATQGEGAIDSAWDELFADADSPLGPGSTLAVIDSGLRRIEPPPQLATVSWEVEPEAPVKPVKPVKRAGEKTSPPVAPPPRPVALSASATEAAPVLTTSTTTPSTPVERSMTAKATGPSRNTLVVLGLLALAFLFAAIGWRLQARATPDDAEPVVSPPPVEPRAEKRSDLSVRTSTLARVAHADNSSSAAKPEPVAVVAAEVAAEEAEADPADQLSAAEFRKLLLRTNRSQRVRTCYQRHDGGDVEMVALVGRSGRIQKLRMDDSALADCLRKVVLRLEFPPAAKQAQHNFVFHPPADAG